MGTPATNASAALSGTVTVVETTAGPIAPVVIPFSGTISPAGTFSLPANFGTSLWSGTIGINVAGVVPNATKVELALDNTLTSNCAVGNSSAKIQKKTVSGPSVAISVNPIQCDLEINKTCCVTQPVLPDLGECDGDMTSMTLEFTGDKCSASNNDQGYSFKCHGKRKVEGPATVVVPRFEQLGDAVERDRHRRRGALHQLDRARWAPTPASTSTAPGATASRCASTRPARRPSSAAISSAPSR